MVALNSGQDLHSIAMRILLRGVLRFGIRDSPGIFAGAELVINAGGRKRLEGIMSMLQKLRFLCPSWVTLEIKVGMGLERA